jgi:tRNA pseudouridine55 synthase
MPVHDIIRARHRLQWPNVDSDVKKTITGLLVLDKPAGISSRAALDRVGRMFPRTKMGHAGTLDPMATGVLVLCIGKATRLIPYVQRMGKQYHATVRLGQRSATHDLEGKVVDVPLSREIGRDTFESCLTKYRGAIMQVPPQHSAVHVGGRRAYELARAGKTVELSARCVTVSRCECTRFEFPYADLDIHCSSGTYVRSIVRDIGDDLNTGAVMTRLVRTAVGIFRLADALSLSDLEAQDVVEHLRPTHEAVSELPVLVVPASQIDDVRHGRTIRTPSLGQVSAGIECALTDASGQVLAVGELDEAGRFVHPRTVLVGD